MLRWICPSAVSALGSISDNGSSFASSAECAPDRRGKQVGTVDQRVPWNYVPE